MGQETVPDREPGQDERHADVAAGSVQSEAAVGRRGHGAAADAGGRQGDDPRASEQGDAGDPSDAGKASHCDAAPTGRTKRQHMRRVLARVDQSRIALRQLSEVIADAERDGIDRAAILEAVHRHTDDFPAQYARLAQAAELLHAIRSPVAFDVIRLDEKPVSSDLARKEAAFEDGFYAENVGRQISDCPYGHDQATLRKAWRDGFNNSRISDGTR